MENCSQVGEEASSNSSKSQTPYEDSDKKLKPKQRLLVPSAESFCTDATKKHMDVDITQIGCQEKIIFEDWAKCPHYWTQLKYLSISSDKHTENSSNQWILYSQKEKHS
jgi:hypothetical protein